ncbi:MAG: heparan-alpha-glucosaminide N-acetyltransferase domain-containing protein, partial [Rikenellaceae bacterium]
MMNNTTKIGRLDLVDALRGFALLAIVLLHNLEHYNMLYEPEGTPAWLQSLDKSIYSVTFFMMAGKAFSTFSLLFGFSFYM